MVLTDLIQFFYPTFLNNWLEVFLPFDIIGENCKKKVNLWDFLSLENPSWRSF